MGLGHRHCHSKGIYVALALTLGASERTLAADDAVQAFPRIRGATPVVRQAIELAAERSPTFQRLVTTINGTDGIVYVHLGQCGRQVLSCLLLAITKAGSNRILHIKVDQRRRGDNMMVSIAHELRHAIELLSDPKVVDGKTAHNFYQRVAPSDGYSFETEAAIETELMVDKELREWERRRRRKDAPRSGLLTR